MATIINKNIKVDKDENWSFIFTFSTFDQRGYGRVPYNLVSSFVLMEIFNTTGGKVASAYTGENVSTSALMSATKGVAMVTFPISATNTSAIPLGLYNYGLYIVDYPDRTSATYIKKVMQGGFEVT